MASIRTCLIVLVLVPLLMECASKTPVTETKTSTTNPTTVTSEFELELAGARKKNVHVLSPTRIYKAEQFLTKAKTLLQENAMPEETLNAVNLGREELRLAGQNAVVATTLLSEALQGRTFAQKAQEEAKKSEATGLQDLAEEYNAVEKRFHKITVALEENDTAYTEKNKQSVTEAYRVIEVKAVKKSVLDISRRTIDESLRIGAKKFAPKSLTDTEKLYTTAEQFIASNPRDWDALRKHALVVQFQANRLAHLTKEGKIFSEKHPEEITLWIENHLSRITGLVGTDHRDKYFDEQVILIEQSVNQLKRTGRTLAEETDRLRGNIETLSTEVEKTQSEVSKAKSETAKAQSETKVLAQQVEKAAPVLEFDKKYEEVRKLFESNEAEVLRDGGRLVIRLRAIQFPMGKATLMTSSYPLLGKVQKGIKMFGEPKVTVEGHTDSVGSAALNEKLSLERAKAVKEYLVANETIKSDKVIVAGFGFTRPLTSDKTPEGRAINRRIDVVIEPVIVP